MIEPIHLLLDDLRHRILKGLRRCARIKAWILTSGGARLGYCATGSVRIASTPASMLNSATTHAKLGRSMKKLTMTRVCFERLDVGASSTDWDGGAEEGRCARAG